MAKGTNFKFGMSPPRDSLDMTTGKCFHKVGVARVTYPVNVTGSGHNLAPYSNGQMTSDSYNLTGEVAEKDLLGLCQE